MANVDELVEKLMKELKLQNIVWTVNPEGFPSFEFGDRTYLLAENSIFVRQKDSLNCYSCGTAIKTKAELVSNGTDTVRKKYDYFCPRCDPKPKSDLSYIFYKKPEKGVPFWR